MNFTQLSQQAREIADRIERMNANIQWLAEDTEKQFTTSEKQTNQQQPTQRKTEIDQLTPEEFKQQFDLRGEQFLVETIAELGKIYPSQLYENPTQKLPSPPPPATHEEILKMIKKGDSLDSILLRFQGEK